MFILLILKKQEHANNESIKQKSGIGIPTEHLIKVASKCKKHSSPNQPIDF